MDRKKERLIALQGFRAVAFIAIFTSHAGMTHLGDWGVSCFLILSGFLMYYNYGEILDEDKVDSRFWNHIKRAFSKIRSLYPLHCVTLLIAIFVYFDLSRLDNLWHIILYNIKLVLNLALLQSWFPKSEFYWSFNAVSWYLSTQFAMYLAFPYIKKAINKGKTKGIRYLGLQVLLILLMQIGISAVLINQSVRLSQIPIQISDGLTFYLTYICPLYRVGDFYLGCIAGYFFMRSDFLRGGVKHPSWLWSLLEIAVVLLLLPSQLIHEGSLKFISDDAVRNDLLYTFPVMASVYLGALQSGFVTKSILSSKWLVELGNISGYCFLIHQLVIVVIFKTCGENAGKLPCAMLSFIITIALAILWKYGERLWRKQG